MVSSVKFLSITDPKMFCLTHQIQVSAPPRQRLPPGELLFNRRRTTEGRQMKNLIA